MASREQAAQALLDRAVDDERAAAALLNVTEVTDGIVGFHAQQAVEKALKAALTARGVEYRLTHDLAYLAERCQEEGLQLPAQLSEVDRLSAFAVRLRCDATPPAPVGREDALGWARASLEWAREVLSAA